MKETFAARRKLGHTFSIGGVNMALTCASFFAGVGGIELGFLQSGFKVLYANEIDKYAVKTYELNFPVKVDHRSILEVNGEEVPDVDVVMGGFPCQAFSVAGYRKGFEDEKGRGTLFFELLRIIKKKKPRVVFCENVKNLVGHDNGNTFRVIREALEDAGYEIKYQVLNGMTYGNVPQNRERIYIVGFRNHEDFRNFDFPAPIPLTNTLRNAIDFNAQVEPQYYYSPERCSFYRVLKKEMKKKDTVYQWRRVYVRENKSNVCPTLTANMGEGGHNVPLILSNTGIRKLTPHECFNLQGYPVDYRLPKDMAQTHLYKQAGNSVVVPVIRRIAEKIKEAIEETDCECHSQGV